MSASEDQSDSVCRMTLSPLQLAAEIRRHGPDVSSAVVAGAQHEWSRDAGFAAAIRGKPWCGAPCLAAIRQARPAASAGGSGRKGLRRAIFGRRRGRRVNRSTPKTQGNLPLSAAVHLAESVARMGTGGGGATRYKRSPGWSLGDRRTHTNYGLLLLQRCAAAFCAISTLRSRLSFRARATPPRRPNSAAGLAEAEPVEACARTSFKASSIGSAAAGCSRASGSSVPTGGASNAAVISLVNKPLKCKADQAFIEQSQLPSASFLSSCRPCRQPSSHFSDGWSHALAV